MSRLRGISSLALALAVVVLAGAAVYFLVIAPSQAGPGTATPPATPSPAPAAPTAGIKAGWTGDSVKDFLAAIPSSIDLETSEPIGYVSYYLPIQPQRDAGTPQFKVDGDLLKYAQTSTTLEGVGAFTWLEVSFDGVEKNAKGIYPFDLVTGHLTVSFPELGAEKKIAVRVTIAHQTRAEFDAQQAARSDESEDEEETISPPQ